MNETLKYERVDISEEEFSQWTTDDQYMIDVVLTKHGVSRKSEAEPSPLVEERKDEENVA